MNFFFSTAQRSLNCLTQLPSPFLEQNIFLCLLYSSHDRASGTLLSRSTYLSHFGTQTGYNILDMVIIYTVEMQATLFSFISSLLIKSDVAVLSQPGHAASSPWTYQLPLHSLISLLLEVWSSHSALGSQHSEANCRTLCLLPLQFISQVKPSF